MKTGLVLLIFSFASEFNIPWPFLILYLKCWYLFIMDLFLIFILNFKKCCIMIFTNFIPWLCLSTLYVLKYLHQEQCSHCVHGYVTSSPNTLKALLLCRPMAAVENVLLNKASKDPYKQQARNKCITLQICHGLNNG